MEPLNDIFRNINDGIAEHLKQAGFNVTNDPMQTVSTTVYFAGTHHGATIYCFEFGVMILVTWAQCDTQLNYEDPQLLEKIIRAITCLP